MPRNNELDENFFFMFQMFCFMSMLFFKAAEASQKQEYKGYFKYPSGADDLLVSDSSCTRDDFMSQVTKSTDNGGCGAEERDMDLSNIVGKTICKTDLRSSYILKYGSGDSDVDKCYCKLLTQVDGNCDAKAWEIFEIAAGCIFVCVVCVCAGVALKKAHVGEKIVGCFDSVKDSASSLIEQCKRTLPSDNPEVRESGEPSPQRESTYNPFIFFKQLFSTENPAIELKDTISPP